MNLQVIENIDLCQLVQVAREPDRERPYIALQNKKGGRWYQKPRPMHKHGLIDSIHASARTRIVTDSASILLVHPNYTRHPNPRSGRNASLSATGTV